MKIRDCYELSLIVDIQNLILYNPYIVITNMSIIIHKISPPYQIPDTFKCSACKQDNISDHRFILFSNIDKYICCCIRGHISYSSDGSRYPGYILCIKTRSVFVSCGMRNIILMSDSIRTCLSADVFVVYQEQQKTKLLKLYNKLRLILHSDIIRHVMAIMIQTHCIS
jgi:hypothetical protein